MDTDLHQLPAGREPLPATAADDLDALLSQPTSYIPPPPLATDEGQEPPPSGTVPPNPGDFEADPQPDDTTADPDAEPPKTRSFYRRQATQFVRTFDVAQKTVLASFVYPRTMLEPGDRALVSEYRTRYKTAKRSNRLEVPVEGDPLWDALRRYEQLDAAVGELPLTDDEKADLVAPLTDVLEKHQKKALTPEWALVVAVFLVMLPRLEPLFPNLFSSLQK
ncbi:hypothetical protein [Fibrella aquatilis]|uniref:Uncharacterized protein n=1 Tax=Fibrella aquatilis TaxID=2817059 RepID=A0A939G3D7_9BACT|nr:hypothetical protein [Fibrella aquatilis]MBO0930350.1 hypothetical protein [Fibrella aquatilis]